AYGFKPYSHSLTDAASRSLCATLATRLCFLISTEQNGNLNAQNDTLGIII
ncbi:hypothetical protein CEXT_586941, partial [Caerostris extrusa]